MMLINFLVDDLFALGSPNESSSSLNLATLRSKSNPIPPYLAFKP